MYESPRCYQTGALEWPTSVVPMAVTCMKVRDVIKRLEADGWYLVATKGSHRQYEHPSKKGQVTVPGHLGDDMPPGTLASVLRQAKLKRSQSR